MIATIKRVDENNYGRILVGDVEGKEIWFYVEKKSGVYKMGVDVGKTYDITFNEIDMKNQKTGKSWKKKAVSFITTAEVKNQEQQEEQFGEAKEVVDEPKKPATPQKYTDKEINAFQKKDDKIMRQTALKCAVEMVRAYSEACSTCGGFTNLKESEIRSFLEKFKLKEFNENIRIFEEDGEFIPF